MSSTYYNRGIGLISRVTSKKADYYLSDYHGSITKLTDVSGNIVADYSYDAFGNVTSQTGTADNPYTYCGEYTDKETGNIYLRARYYDPGVGRFLSQDPYWTPRNRIYGSQEDVQNPNINAIRQSVNLYAYCGNNPIKRIDPLGLFDYDTKLSTKSYNHDDVVALQTKLNELGYVGQDGKPLSVDGKFGANTLYAVNQYKENSGLWNFGEYAGVVGLTTWEHLGLIYREQKDIDAGVKIITLLGKQYFDISKPVATSVEKAKAEFANHRLDVNWFVRKVKNAGEWNVKRSSKVWSDTLGISENSYNTTMLFYGRMVVIDDIGNITYGYLGKAAGFSGFVLKGGSMGYHILNHGLTNFDNEFADEAYVQLGIDWYDGKDIQVRYVP